MEEADQQSPDIQDKNKAKPDVDECPANNGSLGQKELDNLDNNLTSQTSQECNDNDQRLPASDSSAKDGRDDHLPDGLPNTTARVNMPGFMFETKYVMLNFMSLIPPDLYAGHITSSSPDSLASAEFSASDMSKSNPLFSSRSHSLSKSQSVDSGLFKSHPRLKHIHKLQHFQQSIDSTAPYDKTKANCDVIDSPDGLPPDVPEADDHLADLSCSRSLENFRPSTASPRRNMYRLVSDVSSSGDFSYISDADDEYENSNASSIFSSRSIACRDGFLDLRGPHRLSTLHSESESLDETDCDFVLPRHSSELQDVPEGKELLSDGAGVTGPGGAAVKGPGGASCEELLERRRPDKSKLWLDIPCQPVQLSDILVSLQTELNCEMSDLETEYEEAVRSARERLTPPPATTPLTPQTEAARMLARIGDEVKCQYEEQISAAVNKYMLQQAGRMTYEGFRSVATNIVDITLPGWRQVALLFVFGQRVVWKSIQHGNKQIEDVFDYLVRLISDEAADFIIKQGGFGAVMNSDPSQSSDTFSSEADSPQCVIDYVVDLDATRVDTEAQNTGHVTKTDASNTVKQTTVDENSNDTFDGAEIGRSDRTLLAPLADIQKDRLKSFGFDVRDSFDSESKDDLEDESIDFVNFDSAVGACEGRDGNVSASNSDIFIEVESGKQTPVSFDIDEVENGRMQDNVNMILKGNKLRESNETNRRPSFEDSGNVTQESPTLQNSHENSSNTLVEQDSMDIDNSNPNFIKLADDDSSQSTTAAVSESPEVFDTNGEEHLEQERHGSQTARDMSDNQNSTEAPEKGVEESRQEGEPTSSAPESFSHIRSIGLKVMIASIAVLAAGVTIKCASLNR